MKRFKNILYFADGALEVCPALRRAVSLAQSNQARLTVLDVLPAAESPEAFKQHLGSDLDSVLRTHRQAQLDDLVARLPEADGLIYTRVLTGTPFIEVIRSVMRGGHDLLVKAAKGGKGIGDRLLGSTDLHLLRKCPCPVWVDRPESSRPYRRILAAVDPLNEEGAGVDRLVMQLATSLARRESAELHLVHAWRLYGETLLRSGRARISATEVDQLKEQTRQRHRESLLALLAEFEVAPDHPGVHLLNGEPASVIGSLARELSADLVVMGTVGRSGIPGLFIGNTAEEVLQDAGSSILAVKPEGFVSPVPYP